VEAGGRLDQMLGVARARPQVQQDLVGAGRRVGRRVLDDLFARAVEPRASALYGP